MLEKKHTTTDKATIYIDRLKERLEFNCYHIRAKDLKNMLGLSISQIDELLENITDIPIKKYRKVCTTYYIFPIELLITNYMLTQASSLKI